MAPNKKFNKGHRAVILVLFLTTILTACGEATSSSNSPVAPPATTNIQATTSGSTPSQPASATTFYSADTSQPIATATTTVSVVKAVSQPKVIRVGKDGYRNKIEFTEIPPLMDGNPTLLWFDAEG